MKIPKTCKIEKIVSRDPNFPMLLAPYLDVQAGVLMASDKHNGAVVPVEVEEGDVSGPVNIEAIKAGRGGSVSCLDEYCVVPGSAAYPRGRVTGYPPLGQLVSQDEHGLSITLDVKKLLAVAEAMGSGVVTLSVGEGGGLVQVRPYAGLSHIEGSKGFLMPYREDVL